jgi:glycosyltransferase involved in cell wall biosynthesis
MDVKISVIVPTYKRPALLKRCLDALFQQHFPGDEFEIIIVSDGYDEATRYLVENNCNNNTNRNVQYHYLAAKKGPAAARNAGWQTAKGELILFTDDDCVPDKKWLRSYWNTFRKVTSEAATTAEEIESSIAFTGRVYVPLCDKPTDYEKNLARLQEAEFVTANCACTKKALDTVQGFDESFTMAWREDSDLHFKFLKANIPVINVKEALVIHPVRNAQWGVSLKEQRKSMFNALLYKKYPNLYRQRISARPLWNYYGMISLVIIALAGSFLNLKLISISAFAGWLLLLMLFIKKRLSGTSLSPGHVVEMIVTSSFIPFLSVYWTLYGAFKFKKLLL